MPATLPAKGALAATCGAAHGATKPSKAPAISDLRAARERLASILAMHARARQMGGFAWAIEAIARYRLRIHKALAQAAASAKGMPPIANALHAISAMPLCIRYTLARLGGLLQGDSPFATFPQLIHFSPKEPIAWLSSSLQALGAMRRRAILLARL